MGFFDTSLKPISTGHCSYIATLSEQSNIAAILQYNCNVWAIFLIDFLVLNSNPFAEFPWYVKILRKIQLNILKMVILILFQQLMLTSSECYIYTQWDNQSSIDESNRRRFYGFYVDRHHFDIFSHLIYFCNIKKFHSIIIDRGGNWRVYI